MDNYDYIGPYQGRPKVITFPKSEVVFEASPYEDGDEETQLALINPSTTYEMTYKFLTNAESRGMALRVSPPKGVIEPEGSREVLLTLREADPADDLSRLKLVVETWRADAPGDKARRRIPCFRGSEPSRVPSGAASPPPPPLVGGDALPMPQAGPTVDAEPCWPHRGGRVLLEDFPRCQQHRRERASVPRALPADAPPAQPAACVQRVPRCPPPSPPPPRQGVQFLPRPPPRNRRGKGAEYFHVSPPPLPPVGVPASSGYLPGAGEKPTYFIDALPITRDAVATAAVPRRDDSWFDRADVLPYVGSMLVWVGVGIFFGRGYFCQC